MNTRILTPLLLGLALSATVARSADLRVRFPDDPSVIDLRREFGAKGDGKADDTAALQRAIEASCGSGGTSRVLFIPDGTYRVTETLVVRTRSGPWIWGESRDGVVLRMADGIADTNVTAVIRTIPDPANAGSADWFMRNIRNLTVDSGNNPTVDGIRWFGNNSSALQGVRIRGNGPVGVNSAFSGQNGPNLVQDVVIDGFETGIRSSWIWGQTLSRITLRNLRKEGIHVTANAVAIEDLVAENVPVVLRNDYPNDWTWWGGVVALVGGRFSGGDPARASITNSSVLFARDLARTGPGPLLASTTPGGSVTGSRLDEYVSHPVQRAFADSPGGSLRLPVKREPEIPWETDTSRWVCANDFGAGFHDAVDDTAALQKAIDTAAARGATTVYLRGAGGPDPSWYLLHGEVRVHGSVRHLLGLGFGRILGNGQGRFVIGDDSAPVVKLQNFQAFGGTPAIAENRSTTNTLVLEGCDLKILGTGKGDLFATDCPSRVELRSPGQGLWARQLNPEGTDDLGLVRNHGGNLWVLGMKHEGKGVRVRTDGGGRTELFGVFNYGPGLEKTDERPAFVVEDARFSLQGIRELNFGGSDYPVKVREIRHGRTNEIRGGGWIGWPLYSGRPPTGSKNPR
jgi:Pectate lyase superfamily protein